MGEHGLSSEQDVLHIRSAQPYFPPEEMPQVMWEIQQALDQGDLTQGPRVRDFEKRFAAFVGVEHAIAVSNGTAALEIALRYYLLNGGEVIVPTNTFLASANAVVFAGGRPVFADIDASSLCVGLEQIQARITERTRGVVVVHLAGLICPEIAAIREFARTRGLFVIEDAAHAHGAVSNCGRAGALSDAGAFSFFPTKVMTTGEGGMITTQDPDLARFARTFRSHGVPEGKKTHEELGHNNRLGEISAILGLSQLRSLPWALEIRRRIAASYELGLRSLAEIEFIRPPEGSLSSYYKFPILLPTVEKRNTVAQALKDIHHIDTGTVYWPPCHLHPVVRNRMDLYSVPGPLPISEQVLPRVLCLPVHARLDQAAAGRVIDAVTLEVKRTQ